MNVIAVGREPHWQEEGRRIPATVEEFASLYGDFYPAALQLIYAISPGTLFKWGRRDREPLHRYSKGRVTILGDAAHPMTPFWVRAPALLSKMHLCLVVLSLPPKHLARRSRSTKALGRSAAMVFSSLPANRPTKFRALLSGAQIREQTLTTGAYMFKTRSPCRWRHLGNLSDCRDDG
jgi:hypothetical protein